MRARSTGERPTSVPPRDFAHADKRAGHRAHLARATDDPSPRESAGRRAGAKARTHKTRRHTGA